MAIPEEGHPSFEIRTRTTATGHAVAVTLIVEAWTGALKQHIECELTAEEAQRLGVDLQQTASKITTQGDG
jgi:hypothetical protein